MNASTHKDPSSTLITALLLPSLDTYVPAYAFWTMFACKSVKRWLEFLESVDNDFLRIAIRSNYKNNNPERRFGIDGEGGAVAHKFAHCISR
jgi:hypothetical protein